MELFISARNRTARRANRSASSFALVSVRPQYPLRANCNLLNHFKLIWAIQPPEQKYSA